MLDRAPTIRRRTFVATLVGSALALGVTAGWPENALAAGPLPVAVPHIEVAAIAKAVGGSHVRVRVDDELAPDELRIGDDKVSLGSKVMLKGRGRTRRRFLDDPRNAPKVGAAIRDALAKALPSHANAFANNHKQWSRPFARRVLKWQQALRKSRVKGKRVRDDYGRRYALEWAGAIVDPKGRPSPKALADVPVAPVAPTLAAYASYIEALVAALR